MDLHATITASFSAIVVSLSDGIKSDSATVACPKGRL